MTDILDVCYSIVETILDFGILIYNLMFTPITDVLQTYSNDFTDFLYSIMEFTGLSAFFGDFTLLGLLFSVTIITILIVYFFIP